MENKIANEQLHLVYQLSYYNPTKFCFKCIKKELQDILPHFNDRSWRRLTASDWVGKREEGQLFSNRAHPRHGTDNFYDFRNEPKALGRLITVNKKKDDVSLREHPQSDTGQYIDSANQPLFREVRDFMGIMNDYFMGQGFVNAEGAGPFQDHAEHLMDFRDPSVRLEPLSTGRVHAIHKKDLREVLNGRLPDEHAQMSRRVPELFCSSGLVPILVIQ